MICIAVDRSPNHIGRPPKYYQQKFPLSNENQPWTSDLAGYHRKRAQSLAKICALPGSPPLSIVVPPPEPVTPQTPLSPAQQNLEDNDYHIRRNHRELQIRDGLEQPDGLGLERRWVYAHVANVVESMPCKEAFPVQH